MLLSDEEYMKMALEEAQKAASIGEVPIGAVIVDGDGTVLAKAYNRKESDRMATAHAELLAIEEVCRRKHTWRLSDCNIYITLEPCAMCAGAISNARIRRLVFGASNARFGACGGLLNLYSHPLESIPETVSGVLKEDCVNLLKNFFEKRRKDPPYKISQ